MKKRLKIKWDNVIATVLIIDIFRTLGALAFNMTAGLTIFGCIVLLLEIISVLALTV